MVTKDLCHIALNEPMLREMEFILATERCYGEKLIKFVTRSKTAALRLRSALTRLKKDGRICFFVAGESFHPDNLQTQYLLNVFPEIGKDPDLGKKNERVTVVCLYLH